MAIGPSRNQERHGQLLEVFVELRDLSGLGE